MSKQTPYHMPECIVVSTHSKRTNKSQRYIKAPCWHVPQEKETEREVAQPEVSVTDHSPQFDWGMSPMEQPGRTPVKVTARPKLAAELRTVPSKGVSCPLTMAKLHGFWSAFSEKIKTGGGLKGGKGGGGESKGVHTLEYHKSQSVVLRCFFSSHRTAHSA